MRWQLRPARDLELSPFARLRSHQREVGLAAMLVQAGWRRGVRLYLRLYHQLRVTGLEHLPVTPPFVLVGNHTSHLDALTLGAVLRGPAAERAFSLAAGDTFFTSVGSSAFAALAVNALPVWRRRTRAGELALLRQRLVEDGLVYILFPEGSRARDGVMARFQPGLGAMVAGQPVLVVPCHLEGGFAAWPAQARFPRPGRLHLRIGKPIEASGFANDKAGWTALAAAAEAAVRALDPGSDHA